MDLDDLMMALLCLMNSDRAAVEVVATMHMPRCGTKRYPCVRLLRFPSPAMTGSWPFFRPGADRRMALELWQTTLYHT